MRAPGPSSGARLFVPSAERAQRQFCSSLSPSTIRTRSPPDMQPKSASIGRQSTVRAYVKSLKKGLRRTAPGQRVHDPDSHDEPHEPAAGALSDMKTVAFGEHVFRKNTTRRNTLQYNVLPSFQPKSAQNGVHFLTRRQENTHMHTHIYIQSP